MNIKKILVPTDFSEASAEGIQMANEFVELYGSTIDLIHVVPLISYYQESIDHMSVPLDIDQDIYAHAMKNANEKLHQVMEKHIPKEHRGQIVTLIGRKASQVIAQQANTEDYDLIIMSNRGGHTTNSVRSHITEQVIRYSEIPVLSVDKFFRRDEINTILVPLDGSDESMKALISAFEMTRDLNTNLTILHVVEPYVFSLEVMPPVFDDDEEIYSSLIKSIEKYLAAHPEYNLKTERGDTAFENYLMYEDENGTSSVKFQTVIKKGYAAHTEINEYAKEHADMVIMSTHGRTGVSRIVFGSTTNAVAQHMEKPLLTVHPG